MAIQYRQLQAPALIDTNVPDSGGAQAAQALAGAFKQFENTVNPYNTQFQAKRGEMAGAEAGADDLFGKKDAKGNPVVDEKGKKAKDFNRGFTQLSVYAQAYNNAALRSYTIQAEADMETTAARLQVEAADPETFSTKFAAVRDSVLKEAPPEARATLNELYTKRLAAGTVALVQAEAVARKNQGRADLSDGIQMATDRIAQLSAAGDPAKHFEAEEEELKLQMMIEGARNDGTITPIEAEAAHKQSQRAITQQTVTARFRNELENPYGDPIEFIERLKKANKTSNALLPDEEEKLVNSLLSDLQEHNSLKSAGAAQEAAEVKARFAAGDRQATTDLLSGQLTQRKLLEMVRKQELSPEVARTLLNELQTGDAGVDDARTKAMLEIDLLNYTREDILGTPGLSWGTKAELITKLEKQKEGWEGQPRAQHARDLIDGALGIIPGTFMAALTDDQKTQRYQARVSWYDEVSALPPAERESKAISVAQDVIGRYIRKNKSAEAQDLRDAKARRIAKLPSTSGAERAKLEEQIAELDKKIAAAEAEAARK